MNNSARALAASVAPGRARRRRPIRIQGQLAYVPLTKGKEAVVDILDMPLIGFTVWCVNSKGYALSRIDGKITRMHRHLLGVGHAPVPIVDHINGDRLDNRRSNLRFCTNSENNRSMRKVRGRSKYKGVCYAKYAPEELCWSAWITPAHQKVLCLGHFPTEEAAARAYDNAARILFKEFAATNESLGLLPKQKIKESGDVECS